MPSLSASVFGFATGIAIADKIDVVTSTHAARLIKSRRRIGRPSFGYPRFAVSGECFESPTVPKNVTCRLQRRSGGAACQKGAAASRSRRYFGGRDSPLLQPEPLSDLSGSAGSQFSHRDLRPWRRKAARAP